jgi:predicted ArsR family transcriptional regulator
MPDEQEPGQDGALAAAADPTRRALLRLVSRSRTPLGREAAAAALGIPRATAAFHLDRLVEAGLLESRFLRVNGRTGPGAGRPAKLYSGSGGEVDVSIPERHYDLVGDLLSEAVEVSGTSGRPMPDVIADVARARGRVIGATAGSLDAALETTGYEPRVDEQTVVLVNCPFHRLAKRHTDTICAMNVALVEGMAEGAGADPDRVCFAPGQGRCCVEIWAQGAAGAERTDQAARPPSA